MSRTHLYKYTSFFLALQLIANVLWTDIVVCFSDCSKQEVVELLNCFDGESKDEKDEKEKDEKTRYDFHYGEFLFSKIGLQNFHKMEMLILYHPEIMTPPPESSLIEQ